jgi:hypothetical protein
MHKFAKKVVRKETCPYQERIQEEINQDREDHGKRKETMERVFTGAKEKHGMRWTT